MEAENYIFPIVGAHVSLIIGALSYAGKYCDRNSLFGVRTRYSMQSDANWREVNDRVARLMPPISAVAGVVAICGFFVPWLRNVEVLLVLIAVQLGVATYAAMKHGTRMNTDEHG
jgi:uncharacterized membrane protein